MEPFTSISSAVRIHAGDGALDRLPGELARLGAARAFVVCGNSVATRTPLVEQLRAALGDRYAGCYGRMRKDAPLEDVEQAAASARAAGADLLIAVGAGSVVKATRVVAIAMGEGRPLEDLATRYPGNGPPVSPRLLAPKPPIFNVLTAPTSAQNRGGSALRRFDGGARLEFFDPRTRPAAIFWDSDALMTAPPALAQSTGLGVYWRALMSRGAVRQANPLAQAARLHAYALASGALRRLREPDADARLEMCAAALLQNRDEEDGGRPFDAHWIARAVYALGAALFNRIPDLDQGRVHAALTAPALRHFASLCPDAVDQIGEALGVPSGSSRTGAVAAAVETAFTAAGLPLTLGAIGAADRASVLESTLYNFNADRARELAMHRDRLAAMLDEAAA
ncbi:iron-containing alcohol dehydrogenase [Achromobacter aloeverae]